MEEKKYIYIKYIYILYGASLSPRLGQNYTLTLASAFNVKGREVFVSGD